jgi:hypothetical protein
LKAVKGFSAGLRPGVGPMPGIAPRPGTWPGIVGALMRGSTLPGIEPTHAPSAGNKTLANVGNATRGAGAGIVAGIGAGILELRGRLTV